jgi:HPt (histidine-containing phosphotransfer) domain-containing protein
MKIQKMKNISNRDKPAVDMDCLVDKLGGNNKQILRCLEIFKRDAPKLLEIIKTGLKNKESKKAKNSCDGLRGILLTMEMEKAAATAAILETLIIEKRFDTCGELLPILETEIDEAVDFIAIAMTTAE